MKKLILIVMFSTVKAIPMENEIKVNYFGGPTVLFEIEGVRFMSDPTLDEGGNKYQMTPCKVESSQSLVEIKKG